MTLRLHDEPSESERRERETEEERRNSDTPKPQPSRPDPPAQPSKDPHKELKDILSSEPAQEQLDATASDDGVDEAASAHESMGLDLNYGLNQGHDPQGDNWGHGEGYGDEPIPVVEEAAVETSTDDASDKMMREADEGSHAGEHLSDFEDAVTEEDVDLGADAATQDKQRGQDSPSPVSELLAKLKGDKSKDKDGDGVDDDQEVPPPAAPEPPGDGDESEADDGEDVPGQLENAAPDQAQVDADGDGTPDMVDPTPEGDAQVQQQRQRHRELVLDDLTESRTRPSGGMDVRAVDRERLRGNQSVGTPALPKPTPQPQRRGRGTRERRGIRRMFGRR